MDSAAASMHKMKRTTFMGRLQPRERLYVVILIGVFFLMAGMVLFVVRGSKLDKLDREVASLKRGLELLQREGPKFQAGGGGAKGEESLIATTPVVYAQMIEEAERESGVSVSNQEVKPPIDLGEGVQMQTVEFDLRQVTLEQLVKFTQTMESRRDRFVITQRLLIRSSTQTEDRINAEMELVTWERVAAAEGETTEEPAS